MEEVKGSDYIKALKVEKAQRALEDAKKGEDGGEALVVDEEDDILANDDGDTRIVPLPKAGLGGETSAAPVYREDPYAALTLISKIDRIILTCWVLSKGGPSRQSKMEEMCKSHFEERQEAKFLLTFLQPSAAKWHTTRRANMLR